nr:MAG TPA: hypothetical protein [Caudoviricetes sp.]
MKTKEQILKWLDKQPWNGEFYKEVVLGNSNYGLEYNRAFISTAFDWKSTKSGGAVWSERDNEFRDWYNSNGKPMSWKEYCDQNPISIGEFYIDDDCSIQYVMTPPLVEYRSANMMPKKLCKAFIAYMKLIHLRNAWVKDYDASDCTVKIVAKDNDIFKDSYMQFMNGLSFPTHEMTSEFMHTFNDLLEVAKPLL